MGKKRSVPRKRKGRKRKAGEKKGASPLEYLHRLSLSAFCGRLSLCFLSVYRPCVNLKTQMKKFRVTPILKRGRCPLSAAFCLILFCVFGWLVLSRGASSSCDSTLMRCSYTTEHKNYFLSLPLDLALLLPVVSKATAMLNAAVVRAKREAKSKDERTRSENNIKLHSQLARFPRT